MIRNCLIFYIINSDIMYYTAPSQEVFSEMKELAIGIWNGYDDTHGYGTEKINGIKDLKNESDNFMFIYQKFDGVNQEKLLKRASKELVKGVADRLY